MNTTPTHLGNTRVMRPPDNAAAAHLDTARHHDSAINTAKAFTLIELMLIMFLVVVLIAAGAIVGTSAMRAAAIQQTRITLSGAAGVAEEYLAETNNVVNHLTQFQTQVLGPVNWNVDRPYNQRRPWTPEPPNNDPNRAPWNFYNNNETPKTVERIEEPIERFVSEAMKHEVPSNMLAALGEDVFVDKHGDPDSLIARDRPNGFMEIVDGWNQPLIYAAFNNANLMEGHLPSRGAVNNPLPFFVSVGADGDLGTDDDMYSYEVE